MGVRKVKRGAKYGRGADGRACSNCLSWGRGEVCAPTSATEASSIERRQKVAVLLAKYEKTGYLTIEESTFLGPDIPDDYDF